MNRKLVLNLVLTISVGAILFVGTVNAAPPPFQVDLRIEPNRTLPGLAVALQLKAKNGARAIELSPLVRVQATSPSGESFVMDWGEGVDSGELDLGVGAEDDPRFILRANATVNLAVPALDLSRPSWALDQRMLALPGDWTLRVMLYANQGEEDGDPEPAAISNPAKLTIEAPSGRDVEILEAIQRREYWGIAEKLLTEREDSKYFPYLSTCLARRSLPEQITIIERAIQLHPTSPVVPRLRYAIAMGYGSEADRVFDEEEDLEKAVALAEKGRSQLKHLTDSKDTWSTIKAREKLDDFPSRGYFADLERLKHEKGSKKP